MRYFDLRMPPAGGLRSVAYKGMQKFLVAHDVAIGRMKFPEDFGRKGDTIRLFERRLGGSSETRAMILSLLSCLHESEAVEVGVVSVDLGGARLYLHIDKKGEYIGHMIAFPRKDGGYSFA